MHKYDESGCLVEDTFEGELKDPTYNASEYNNTPDMSTFKLENYDEAVDMDWKYNNLLGIRPTNSNTNRKRVKNPKKKRKDQKKARKRNRK